jgi:hypothetical protein
VVVSEISVGRSGFVRHGREYFLISILGYSGRHTLLGILWVLALRIYLFLLFFPRAVGFESCY